MAFSKDDKSKKMAQYTKWLEKSQGVFMMEYSKMDMKVIDGIRAKVREAGGEAHLVKNTLIKKTLEENGYPFEGELAGATLVGFAFDDPAAVAKTVNEIIKSYSKDNGFKIKGGYLDKSVLDSAEIAKLGNLPSLSVMRAMLLGTIMAPASQLVRTINEPGRSLAAVVQAMLEKNGSAAAE